MPTFIYPSKGDSPYSPIDLPIKIRPSKRVNLFTLDSESLFTSGFFLDPIFIKERRKRVEKKATSKKIVLYTFIQNLVFILKMEFKLRCIFLIFIEVKI